ncbi:MAG: hypothetical protein AABX17_03875 [Nanoarchaeota archaeon]
MKIQDFSRLKKGDVIIISWLDPKNLELGNLAPTLNIGFYYSQDKREILISNIISGKGKSSKFNVTIIPKNLVTNLEVVRRKIK